MNLFPSCECTLVSAATGAGTTTITGTAVDMSGFDGVLFLTSVGTANAGNTLHAVSGTDASITDAADLAGTKVTSGTSDEVLKLNVYRPVERYVAPRVTRGASTTIGEMWAIRYQARVSPKNESVSGTSASKTVASPAEGTP